ncbi:MAG: DUF1501 domain-containing protein [Gammaproteobacteria bacterium]|nr:DUF1501 domain-containing protein [Gammaproteobacteria bacterium]
MTVRHGRRRFLKVLGMAGAQLAVGTAGLSSWIRNAQAAPPCDVGDWGAIPGSVGGWTCATHPGYKILEIYLHAGASPWETLWLPGNAAAPNFADYGIGTLPLNLLNWGANTAQSPCQAPAIPSAPTNAQLFAAQSGGGNIYWGAPAKPLYRRNDILPRCRMITQYHELAPHEAAIPFALAGLRLGNPRRAGTGAAVQRRARVVNSSQVLPVSYVLHRNTTFTANNAATTGTHPGFTRPLVIQIQNTNAFVNNLARTGITAESDSLLLSLRHEYRDRLRFRGAGDPVRSSGFDGYWVASELLDDAPSLQALVPGNMLVIDTDEHVCPTHPAATAGTVPQAKTMLHAAASLLSSGPARYVCTIDSGLTGTYDTHGDGSQMHLLNTSANFYNVLHHLADIIHHPVNNPTGTLNLDDTMVIINSEFGRTPNINGNNGRDHWPQGYVTTLIGGPLNGGASIRGAIDNTGVTVATHRYTPTDVRGALLLAAGIDPFAEGNFRFSDFSDVLRDGIATEAGIRDRLRGWILGL